MITTGDRLAHDAILARPQERLTCEFGMNESDTSIHDPYGGTSARNAGRLGRTQIGPLLQYLGFGPQAGSPRALRMDQRLQNATGPLADFIQQLRGYAPGVYQQGIDVGNRIAGQGQNAYDTFQGALGQSLGDVNYYGGGARRAHELALNYANQAASPTADEDLYQVAQRRVMAQLRPSLAARGLEGSTGAGAQAESDVLRGLATDFAGQRRADRYNSLQALEGAGSYGAGLAGARTQMAGSGMDAVGQLAQLLQAQYGIPMQAFGQILNLLTAGQQPGLALTQATAPQLGTSSSGWRLV